MASSSQTLAAASARLPAPLVFLVRVATGLLGALACLIKSMGEGGLPAEQLNRCMVSMMSEALDRPDIGDGACFGCAGSGEAAIGAETARCGVCAGSGRMVAA